MAAALEPPVPRPPSVADELDEAILAATEGVDASLPDSVQRWTITNVDEAEWALRKLARLQARLAEVQQQAAIWRDPIDAWEHAEASRVQPGIEFFTRRLQDYAILRRAVDERENKTLRLPSGTVATRRPTEPKVTVEDEAAVIAWAQASLNEAEYEQVVKTEEKVLVTGLRAVTVIAPQMETTTGEIVSHAVVHPDTGELVPGVSVVMPETTAGPVKIAAP